MLENKSTRGTKKPATAAKKAAPKVAVKSAPIGGNGEVSPSQATQAAALFGSIPDLVNILAENIRHNTELLAQIDQRRAATETGDRPAGVEQMRTILDYKAIGQMTGRRGDAFQKGNLIAAHRTEHRDADCLTLFDVPVGAAKVSVQVDGAKDPEVKVIGAYLGGPLPEDISVTLTSAAGRNIGRIEVLNSQDEPIRLGPRMVAAPLTNIRSAD